MKMEVEVISREIIKPTTSSHPDKYNFSFFDQNNPPWAIPVIYFFNLDRYKLTQNQISTHLKTSLSLVLNHYYPLIGTLQQNFIDCNNGGVLVFEARVNCNLSEFLQNPNPGEFVAKFLPDNVDDFVLAVQVNFFNCGGIAIGVCISHRVADGSSVITFINNWAETARGNIDNVRPKIVGTSDVFPLKEGGGKNSLKSPPDRNLMSKLFVFTNATIAAIREKYVATSSSSAENRMTYPSRVKTLISFLWSRFAASTEINKGPKATYMLVLPVNFRKMTDPPLPDDSFGNVSGSAMSIISSEDGVDEEGYNYGVVNKLTRAASKLNKEFVKKLQDGKGDTPYVLEEVLDENIFKGDGRLIRFVCSSMCRSPIYETDFGWGKPVWFAIGGSPIKNTVFLADTKNGDGIEAWVNLTEEDMPKFETDKELLTYASPTSSSS